VKGCLQTGGVHHLSPQQPLQQSGQLRHWRAVNQQLCNGRRDADAPRTLGLIASVRRWRSKACGEHSGTIQLNGCYPRPQPAIGSCEPQYVARHPALLDPGPQLKPVGQQLFTSTNRSGEDGMKPGSPFWILMDAASNTGTFSA
jgi:hypothetical protein